MIRKFLFTVGSLFLCTYSVLASAAVPAVGGETVQIGCNMPPAGASGASVYSVDKLNAAGTEITLPAVVKNGSSCTQAVNAVLAESLSSTCSGGYWVLQNGTPMLVTIDKAGYALQYFVLRCTAP
jgi:hypothetical protein